MGRTFATGYMSPDHVDALQKVISEGKVGETYTIGANNEKSNLELVQCVCKLLDKIKPNPTGKPYSNQIQFLRIALGTISATQSIQLKSESN